MIRIFLLLSLSLFSIVSYAKCASGVIQYGLPIDVDISDKLTPESPVWTGTFSTQYSGSFTCSTNKLEFAYTPILSTDSRYATILGFDYGKYNVRVEITDAHPNITLSGKGSHSASELNTNFTVRFSLIDNGGSQATNLGNIATLGDVIFVSDMSGLSLVEIIAWPIKQLVKILQWLLNGFHWPYDSRDMYGQPMTIKYMPKQTTCYFNNTGLSVTLPTVSINQITNENRAGLTPFILNMRCNGLSTDGTAGRAIGVFLSSNNILPEDNSVLVDNKNDAAKGVGLRVIKQDSPATPVVFSTSSSSQGNASTIFSVDKGSRLNNNFTIPMAVYYYSYSPHNISQGTINTSATLNIIYP
ncbi:fimbrial protein [Klebsiella aerogenes]|nr:fimbrial protein [Klebsiella aerogenes]ELA2606819.1 fimbrial protein [Klebsiella aerogenes]EMC9823461.1 fimbrial protein [Klebsiella aerogenes]HEO1674994.1 fimbrial protein [Klebsiella aerogenes]